MLDHLFKPLDKLVLDRTSGHNQESVVELP